MGIHRPQALIPDAAGKVVGVNHYAGPTWKPTTAAASRNSVKGRQDGGPGNIPLAAPDHGGGRKRTLRRRHQRAAAQHQGGVAPEGGCDARAVGRRIHVEYPPTTTSSAAIDQRVAKPPDLGLLSRLFGGFHGFCKVFPGFD